MNSRVRTGSHPFRADKIPVFYHPSRRGCISMRGCWTCSTPILPTAVCFDTLPTAEARWTRYREIRTTNKGITWSILFTGVGAPRHR